MDPSADARRLEPDEPLPALADLVGALFEDIVGIAGEGLELATLVVDLPIEIGLETDAIRCAPPTQYTETSVMPVFHRLRLTLEKSDVERGDGG